MRKNGFSLVEILLVIGLFGMLLATANVLMFSSLKNGKKVAAVGTANDEGAYVVRAIEQMVKFGTHVECTSNSPPTLKVTKLDGKGVIYTLTGTKISSQSAETTLTMDLTTPGVTVTAAGCPQGVFKCSADERRVDICFGVENTGAASLESKAGSGSNGIIYSTSVTVRN